MLAVITKTQELALDQTEAHELAEGIANVSRHYDIETSQKALDWTRLMMVLGMVYGTRLYAIRAKRAAAPRPAQPQRPQAQPAEVIIPGVGPGIFDPGTVQ